MEVQLRNGSTEPANIVEAVSITLKRLYDGGNLGVTAFHDLVMLCRNPNREETNSTRMTSDTLKREGFLLEDGTVHDSTRNVVLSSVEGDGLAMQLISPIVE